jgi:spermidine synthase
LANRRSLGLLLDAITVFLSAVLLFQIQPVYSKYILPWFGGAPQVWTTALVFFQTMLLGGYAYAHFLASRLQPRGQFLLHGALLLLSLLFVPVIPAEAWKPAGTEIPTWRILAMLAATLGLPYFLLSSTSPLVQSWIARFRHGAVPYRLFSLSNLASIIGLLSYPFLVEPTLGLRRQFDFWAIGYVAFVVSIGLLMAFRWKLAGQAVAVPGVQPDVAVSDDGAAHISAPTNAARLTWVIFAACPSILFLAVTNQLTQDVAPVPFLWVLPLVLYLLTFAICFEYFDWLPRTAIRWLAVLFVFLLGLSMSFRLFVENYIVVIALYCTGLFVASLFCHGELYARRPAPRHLTQFYLMVSVGGALGGMFVGLFAPYVFTSYWEINIGLGLCGLLVFYVTFEALKLRKPLRIPAELHTVPPLAAAALILAMPLAALRYGQIETARNFFGALRVQEKQPGEAGDAFRQLAHGSTSHGIQFLAKDRECESAAYYGPQSGARRLMSAVRSVQSLESMRVGVIGLGVGSLAADAAPKDAVVFYEIDPLVDAFARTRFSFLTKCNPGVQVHLGDARVVMESEAPNKYNVLVLDAFSGDSIPMHLLTTEAFSLYASHLAPEGAIAVHISNRYLDLMPVVKAAGERHGFTVRFIRSSGDANKGYFEALWAVLVRDEKLLAHESLGKAITDSPQTDRTLLWTDDFSNLLSAIR